MIRFTYTDRSFGAKARSTAGQVLMSCVGESILQADAALTALTGLIPASDPTIWCRVQALSSSTPKSEAA